MTTFVDDIIVYSKTIAEHANHVRIVIDQLNGAHLKFAGKEVLLCTKVRVPSWVLHTRKYHPSGETKSYEYENLAYISYL